MAAGMDRTNTMRSVPGTFRPFEIVLTAAIVLSVVGLLTTRYYMWAWMPAVAVPLFFLLGRFPHFAYYLIVFLIPSDALRELTVSYKWLTASKLLGVWLVVFLFFSIILKKRQVTGLKSNLWPWFGLFLVANFLSALLTENHLTAFDDLRRLLVAYLFFAMTLIFVTPKGFRETLPKVIVGSVLINVIYAVLEYFLSGTAGRATGTSADSNVFSAMIIFTLPLVVHWFFASAKMRGKVLAASILMLDVTAVILTNSRGGALILALAVGLLAVAHLKRFRPKYLGFVTSVVAAVLILTLILVPPSYWKRQQSVTDTTDPSVGRRVTYLYLGWEMVKENLFLGAGGGTFREHYARSNYAANFVEEDEQNEYWRYAHNSYLEVLVGNGMVGFLFFCGILVVTLKNFQRARKRFQNSGDLKTSGLIFAYELAFFSLLLYFFVLSNLYHKYFWIPLALSQIAVNMANQLPKGQDDAS